MSKPLSLRSVFTVLLLLLRNLLIAVAALGIGLTFGYMLAEKQATWPITLTGLALYTLVILADPLAGLLLWIVTAPFSRFIYLDIIMGRGIPDLTLTRICAGLLLIVVVAQLGVGRQRMFKPHVVDGAVLVVLIAIGSSLPASQLGLKGAFTSFADSYLAPGIIYFLGRLLVRSRSDAEKVCSAFIIMGVILAAVAIQEQLSDSVLFVYSERSWTYTKDIHKLAGLLGSPAFFATLMAMAAGFTVYRFVFSRTVERRLLYGALLALLGVGIYYTYNRAGWLALAISLVIMAVAWPGFRRLFIAVALVGGLALAFSWTAVENSAVVTQRLQARGPIEYRLEIWGRAALIVARNPLFGLGYNNFGPVYLQYNPAWITGVVLPAPHNSFLEVTFDTGLVGGIPYVVMFGLIGAGIIGFYRKALWSATIPSSRNSETQQRER